jgi:uncharacterized protein (DUF1330 family)
MEHGVSDEGATQIVIRDEEREAMPAYIVVEVEVLDKERYENYKQMVPPSLAAYGGRFLVRGGAAETLEGTWSPKRLVILEFPSVERAKAWWESSEYADAKALRQATARTQMIVVEGV